MEALNTFLFISLFMNEKLLEAVETFVNAYNNGDMKSVEPLLSEDVLYISSSGEQTSGKSKVLELYVESLQKYGDRARYELGNLNETPVALIFHKSATESFERAVYKIFVLDGDKISRIVAHRDKENLDKIKIISEKK